MWNVLLECIYLDHRTDGALCSENENSVSRNRFLFCSPELTSASSLRRTSLPPEHLGNKRHPLGDTLYVWAVAMGEFVDLICGMCLDAAVRLGLFSLST